MYKEIISGTGGALAGSVLVALFAAGIAIASIILIAIYVYHSWTWMIIAKRQKHRYPWLSWIPFASSAMRLQLGKFHWALVFLWLIPIAGWIAMVVLLTIAHWRIFKGEGYPNWLSLFYPLMFLGRVSYIGSIGYLITIGFLAWKPKTGVAVARAKAPAKRASRRAKKKRR